MQKLYREISPVPGIWYIKPCKMPYSGMKYEQQHRLARWRNRVKQYVTALTTPSELLLKV
jgi:hypothetical protein